MYRNEPLQHEANRLSAVAGTELRTRQKTQEGTIERRLPAYRLQHAQKREGDFSCETSPSLFRFSEIRSDSRSQRLSSRNHSAPTSDSPCFYLTLP